MVGSKTIDEQMPSECPLILFSLYIDSQARQELARGRRDKVKPVYEELSMFSFDFDTNDIGYRIADEVVWTRPAIHQF